MKFLLDQDVYAATVRFLRGLGHDILTASEAGKATASDSHLLELARRSGRVLVTRDRDFGSLVWVEGLTTGVIYLRIHSSLQGVHEELEAVSGLDPARLVIPSPLCRLCVTISFPSNKRRSSPKELHPCTEPVLERD